jgi:hypothetical protein
MTPFAAAWSATRRLARASLSRERLEHLLELAALDGGWVGYRWRFTGR